MSVATVYEFLHSVDQRRMGHRRTPARPASPFHFRAPAHFPENCKPSVRPNSPPSCAAPAGRSAPPTARRKCSARSLVSWGRSRKGGKRSVIADRRKNRSARNLPASTSLSRSRFVAAINLNIHLLGSGVAKPRKLARLQDAKKMRLQIERKIADLIEKESATMGCSDKADSIAIRTSECTLHETEEFRANQCRRNRSAIQCDKWSFHARAMTINSPSDQFLSGPGFSFNQNGQIGSCDLAYGLQDARHLRGQQSIFRRIGCEHVPKPPRGAAPGSSPPRPAILVPTTRRLRPASLAALP